MGSQAAKMGLGARASTGPTQVLANFVARTRWSDLPAPVQARVRLMVIDTIASALGGHDAAESAMIQSTAALVLGGGTSPVIGGAALSQSAATLANGYLITAVNLCDVHHATLCHVTPEVVPPALAVAEERDVSGAEFLTAVGLGMEVTTRIAVGTHYEEFRRRGWHSPGVAGPCGGRDAPRPGRRGHLQYLRPGRESGLRQLRSVGNADHQVHPGAGGAKRSPGRQTCGGWDFCCYRDPHHSRRGAVLAPFRRRRPRIGDLRAGHSLGAGKVFA